MSAITGIPGLRRLRRACATLALSAAIGAAGVSPAAARKATPFKLSDTTSSQTPIGYAFLHAAALSFSGGGRETGWLFGAGVMLGTLGGASSSFPELSYGIELDSLNLTGTGAGWGIEQLRGVIRAHLGNQMVVSVLAGPARLRTPFSSETGLSLGLGLEIPLFGTPFGDSASSFSRPGEGAVLSARVNHYPGGFGIGLNPSISLGFAYYFSN